MSSEGQFTAFTRAIVEYFIITTFTGAVRFVFLHEAMERSCVVNTGECIKHRYWRQSKILLISQYLTCSLSYSVTESHDSSSAPPCRRTDGIAKYTQAKALKKKSDTYCCHSPKYQHRHTRGVI